MKIYSHNNKQTNKKNIYMKRKQFTKYFTLRAWNDVAENEEICGRVGGGVLV